MTKRLTLDEIRSKYGTRQFSEMSASEKAAHIAQSLERSRQRIEEQSRMIAELRRRMDANEPPRPKLGLKTLDEVRAYVDRIAKGSNYAAD